VTVPDMPDPLPEPRVHLWPAGMPIVRCHDAKMGATEFNSTAASRRFRPVSSANGIVATIYGADLRAGALSETVFHDVPIRGPARRIQRKALIHMVLSTIVATRELRLVELHGAGLGRLHVTHAELIETSASHYPRTAQWAQALHDGDGGFDGLAWRSRQFNDSLAVMLWGDRVSRFEDLQFDPNESPLPLFAGPGFQVVQELANDLSITVIA
jgi:RES domain